MHYRLRVKDGEHSTERMVIVNTAELWFLVGVPVLRMSDTANPGGGSLVRGTLVLRGKPAQYMWVRIDGI